MGWLRDSSGQSQVSMTRQHLLSMLSYAREHSSLFPSSHERALSQLAMHSRRRLVHVTVSSLQYKLFWCSFFSAHVLCIVFFGGVAWCYAVLPRYRVSKVLTLHGVGLSNAACIAANIVHSVVALAHALCLLEMVVRSIQQQALTTRNVTLSPLLQRQPTFPKLKPHWFTVIRAKLYRRYRFWFGPEGRHFNDTTTARQVIERVLQTYQAQRLSQLINVSQLNLVYVGALVLAFWSSPLIAFTYRSATPLEKNLLMLIADCLAHWLTIVVVPMVVATHSVLLQDLDSMLIDGDQLSLVQALMDSQVVLTTTWSDLACRLLLCALSLVAIQAIKNIVRPEPRATSVVGPQPGLVLSGQSRKSGNSKRSGRERADQRPALSRIPSSSQNSSFIISKQPRASTSDKVRATFVLWGLGVLIAHLDAESSTQLSQCALRVRPWLATMPVCPAVTLECSSAVDSLFNQLAAVDTSQVQALLIRGCPQLDVPANLKDLKALQWLQVTNSTIAHWNATTALSSESHGCLIGLVITDVEFAGGVLSSGLQSDNFPTTLAYAELSNTNLVTLPDDLHTRWPPRLHLVMDSNTMTVAPKTIAKLDLVALSLADNQLTCAPSGVLALRHLRMLVLSLNPMKSIECTDSNNMTDLAPQLEDVFVEATNVSTLPSWLRSRSTPLRVFAAATPMCQRIVAGAIAPHPLLCLASTSFPRASVLAHFLEHQ